MTLRQELTSLLNRHSAENLSSTPDFILAKYLHQCLANWDECVQQRDAWLGRDGAESAPLDEPFAVPDTGAGPAIACGLCHDTGLVEQVTSVMGVRQPNPESDPYPCPKGCPVPGEGDALESAMHEAAASMRVVIDREVAAAPGTILMQRIMDLQDEGGRLHKLKHYPDDAPELKAAIEWLWQIDEQRDDAETHAVERGEWHARREERAACQEIVATVRREYVGPGPQTTHDVQAALGDAIEQIAKRDEGVARG